MIEKVAEWIVLVFGFGLSLYLIKKWINDLSADVKILTKNHHLCREELPKEYADKKHTDKSFSKLWTKVDQHTASIGRLIGRLRLNGSGADPG